MRFFKSILLFLNLLVAALLLIAYTAGKISPADNIIPAFFGLIYLVLFLTNLFFVFFWSGRNKRIMLISLLTILLGWGYLSKNVQLMNKAKKIDPSTRILSYNVQAFDRYNWPEKNHAGDSLLLFLQQLDADILCLQEFNVGSKGKITQNQIFSALKNTPYHHLSNSRIKLATLTQYPIVHTKEIKFAKNAFASAMFSDLKIGEDTVRVFNIHLESTQLTDKDYNHIKQPDNGHNKKIRAAKTIVSKLKIAFQKRAKQVDILNAELINSPYPIILCGDFNDTPVSYSYKKLSCSFTDTFQEKGSGFGFTYNGKIPFFRIDYILHDPGFKTLNFNIEKVTYSDHYPVWAEIQLP